MTSEPDQQVRDAVVATALDYYEGWFGGDAVRMRRALHPELVKRSLDAAVVDQLSAQQMVDGAAAGLGRRPSLEGLDVDVRVQHVHAAIAAATVTSTVFVDYLHLVEVDGRWQILNVLWCRA